MVFIPFRTALPLREQITWSQSDIYIYFEVCTGGTKTCRTALPFRGQVTLNQIDICVSEQLITRRYLSRLGLHSRFGDKLLGIRVIPSIHESVQCSTKMVFIPFRTAVPFRGQITWNQSGICVSVQCNAKMVFIPFRTVVPFWEQINWNQSGICVSVQCTTTRVCIPLMTAGPFRGQVTWNQSDIQVSVQCTPKGMKPELLLNRNVCYTTILLSIGPCQAF